MDNEIARLKQWIADLQSGMYINCVYCGHRYGPGETTPVSMADALKAHIEVCPEHPMSKLTAKYKRLEEALQLIADGKADQWIDTRSKYTRWIAYPGGTEIIRQVATMVLRDIDEPDATDFWVKAGKQDPEN